RRSRSTATIEAGHVSEPPLRQPPAIKPRRRMGKAAIIGLAASWFLTRLLSSLLYGTGAYSPTSLVSATIALSAATLLAGYIPARHAAGSDPVMALRS